MAKNCPGCGAPLEYDPGFDALVCGSCGNIVDPKSLPDAQDFYLAVLPGTINGLTLKFENASGSVESQHESSKTVEFKRSKIYDFGTYVIDKEIK